MGIRAFIAIPIPDIIASNIHKLQLSLQKSSAEVRWVSAYNYHLTIKFLGDITTSQINDVKEAIYCGIMNLKPFSLNFSGVGGFPNDNKPRVIWVGTLQGKNDVMTLQNQIDTQLHKLGFELDSKQFFPHLTIGRIKKPNSNRSLRVLMEEKKGYVSPAFSVSSISLFKSELTPKGPIYTSLEDFFLEP